MDVETLRLWALRVMGSLPLRCRCAFVVVAVYMFSKVLCIVILYSKYTVALTFENFYRKLYVCSRATRGGGWTCDRLLY